MGVFSHEIAIAATESSPARILEAVVDTGAMFTQVPGSVLEAIGVTPIRRARFQLADGTIAESDIGEAFVTVNGERTRTLCVFGEEGGPVILGAYALEGLLLAADPVNQRLVPVVAPRLTRLPASGWLTSQRRG